MTDSNPANPRRRQTQLLVALGVLVVAAAVYMMWPSAATPAAPSKPVREQRSQAAGKGAVDSPAALNVQLEALKQTPPAPDEAARNPFRFYVKPPPPPPPAPRVPQVGDKDYKPPPPVPPPPQAGPPPIPLKFIGTVEKAGHKVAIFVSTDGRGLPVYAGEGEVVLGQYRVVKIGVESVTLEYLDGRGRQTIPMRG